MTPHSATIGQPRPVKPWISPSTLARQIIGMSEFERQLRDLEYAVRQDHRDRLCGCHFKGDHLVVSKPCRLAGIKADA